MMATASNPPTGVGIRSSTSGAATASEPPPQGTRYKLRAESELRLELTASTAGAGGSVASSSGCCTLRLVAGSAEIFGAELAIGKDIELLGGGAPTKLVVFTWHGCTIDVDDGGNANAIEMAYVSEETQSNVAFVNTHAQLEAMRDSALAASEDGPRVLVVGGPDSGKTSLVRTLAAYAAKLGRTPLLVDLDPSCNSLSVPGTLTASPVTPDTVSPITHGLAGGSLAASTPLCTWYGSQDLAAHPDLYKALVEKLGRDIDERFSGDVDGKASGILVNTSGWIEELGYQLLLHAAEALRINVILIMGHDRLYSMITTHFRKKAAQEDEMADDEAGPVAAFVPPKIIKLPRSGGVVSRDSTFRRLARMQCIKRYFNGDMLRSPDGTVVQQYTPYLSEAPFQNIKLYKLSSVSLAASMLPVSAKQTTDPVQLTPITDLNPTLQHAVLAVCHPSAVEAFQKSGEASDLYLSGIAGFVVVEKVHMEKSSLSLLSPCSGELPSFTFLIGDIVWIE